MNNQNSEFEHIKNILPRWVKWKIEQGLTLFKRLSGTEHHQSG